MADRLPYSVFLEWMDYYNRDPFSVNDIGVRIGYASAQLAVAMVGSEAAKKAELRPSDFMPDKLDNTASNSTERTHKEIANNQMKKLKAMAVMNGWNITDKRKEKDGKNS